MPEKTRLSLDAARFNDSSFMLYSLSRKTQIGPGVPLKGEVIEIEQRVDGRNYARYYVIESEGPIDYHNGKHIYEATKLADKKAALAYLEEHAFETTKKAAEIIEDAVRATTQQIPKGSSFKELRMDRLRPTDIHKELSFRVTYRGVSFLVRVEGPSFS